ncbi:Uncharacterized protein TCM_029014 [Theobroma cacao]|uniref:Uncharacterized protein n=1 Tax=Theobroma cacao TaxID=3641 RepID=A0A061GJ36_THECC|nr:Uncharacterized protein TCM_029014 [Theobroma cacao]
MVSFPIPFRGLLQSLVMTGLDRNSLHVPCLRNANDLEGIFLFSVSQLLKLKKIRANVYLTREMLGFTHLFELPLVSDHKELQIYMGFSLPESGNGAPSSSGAEAIVEPK